MSRVYENNVICPHCKARLDEPHYKVFAGMRLVRETHGRKLYEVKCHLCGCVFDVDGGKALAQKKPPVTHHVRTVIGGAFKTTCGIYLANEDKVRGSAYADQVTCGRCLRSRTLSASRWPA